MTDFKNVPCDALCADRYELYSAAVQNTAFETALFYELFELYFIRTPYVLREDFCGTAAISYQWSSERKENQSYGFDTNPEPLEWGRIKYKFAYKEEVSKRVVLQEKNVLSVHMPEFFDIACAQNFSFWTFKTRETLLTYFRNVYNSLKEKSLFVLDMMGGPACQNERVEEETIREGFQYVWENRRFNPINSTCTYAIHFRFPDGSEMRDAFVYEWRLWTISEVKELLYEAGFQRADVYWEDIDPETEEGTGHYQVVESVDSFDCWVCYLVATKT